MPKKPTYQKVETNALREVPASINREIGRIIVRWAFVEFCLQKIVWRLVGVDDAVGRLAIRDPRATDRIDMIVDLAALHSIKIDKAQIREFREQVNYGQIHRDILAHGLWGKYPDGSLRVVRSTGQHPKNIKQVPHRSRRVAPSALTVTVEQLRDAIEKIDWIIKYALELEVVIKKLLEASPKKSA